MKSWLGLLKKKVKVKGGVKPLAMLGALVLFYTSTLTLIGYYYLLPKFPNIKSLASGYSGQIYLSPSSTGVSGETKIQLWVNSNSYPFDFIHTNILFDKSVVQLSREIVYQGTLARVIKLSTMQEANGSGSITLTAGLDPVSQNRSLPPRGTYLLAEIFVKPITTQNNVATLMDVNNVTVRMVDIYAGLFNVTTGDTSLVLNPLAPTATSTPRPTATVTPRPTATIAPTATRAPTSAPTVASTPQPTSTPGLSCASICISAGYGSGTCRSDSSVCLKRKEINVPAGNGYCVSGKNNTCCCK